GAGWFADFAVISTTGAAADCELIGCAGGGGAGAAGAAATWVGALLAAAERVGAGLATTVWVVRLTVRVLTVFAAGGGESSLVVAVVLASGVAGVASVTGGGTGAGAGCGVAVIGWVVTGRAVCADKEVEESARAAAIAGSALANA